MSSIDQNYHKLTEEILSEGYKYEDPNRKGVQRIEVGDYKLVHNFSSGFPAISTKKLAWKSVVGELIWILRGDTNIKYLVDNGINIWNKDAYNHYCKECKVHDVEPMSLERFIDGIKNTRIFNKHFIPSISNYKLGDIGRGYGAQLRNWSPYEFMDSHTGKVHEHKGIDQLADLIHTLKTNPMATKKTVTFWNPAEKDQCALTPCHWSFEVLVEPLSLRERQEIAHEAKPSANDVWDTTHEILDDGHGIPKYQFTLKWHQHSVDTFLGLPFNIASYALLAQIIGKITNMVPKGIIGDFSNVHIYEPHLDAVKEQLSRDVSKYNKCELHFAGEEANQGLEKGLVSNIDNLNIRNFKLRDYKSYPRIPAEMLPYNK